MWPRATFGRPSIPEADDAHTQPALATSGAGFWAQSMPALSLQGQPETTTPVSHESQSKRVLVVDDEPSVVLLLRHLLEDAGYLTGSAADGIDGLLMFQEGPWNLVII